MENIIYFLRDLLITLPAVIIAITIHEFSHGYVAYLMGDSTAKNAGRLTLNPLRHLDPFGVLCLIIFKFGWANPVPVNMYYFKKPKIGMAFCAAAGPVSNLFIAFLTIVPYKLLYYFPVVEQYVPFVPQMLSYIVVININLALFNLIPVPPLDGSKIVGSFLPTHIYQRLLSIERYGMIILIFLLYTKILSTPLSFCSQKIISGMFFLLNWF